MKIIKIAIIVLVVSPYLSAQWSNSSEPVLSSGDAHIESDNPYLFFDLNDANSQNGGLWFENQGSNKARIVYNNPTNQINFTRIIGSSFKNLLSLKLSENQMSPSSEGFIRFGSLTGNHLDFDHNEIQSRSGENLNGTLYLNFRGGDVDLGNRAIYVDRSAQQVGIGTDAPDAKLHVEGDLQVTLASEFNGDATFNNKVMIGEEVIMEGNLKIDRNDPRIELNDSSSETLSGIIAVTDNGPLGPTLAIVSGTNLEMYAGGDSVASLILDTLRNVSIGLPNQGYKFSVQGNGNFTGELTASSDARFKQNITPIDNGLDMIRSLNPVSYEFKKEEFAEMQFSDEIRYGLIAQEVESLLPELVSKSGKEEYRSLNYIDLIPFLIKAIQEQQIKIEELEKNLKL